MRRVLGLLFPVWLVALGSCSTPGRTVSMDYAALDFYAAPFPGEHLRRDDGSIDLTRAPNPTRAAIVRQIHAALEDIDGFGTSSPIHFRLDGAIDVEALPDAFTSTDRESALLLVDVDPTSPERGSLRPFTGYYAEDGGPYGDEHLLTLLPVQGMPLRTGTLYAAIVTDRLRGAAGEPMQRPAAMDDVIAGRAPAGMSARALESFRAALGELEAAGIPTARVIAMTAFRTGDPLAVLARAVAASEGVFETTIAQPFVADEVFDDFCVFHATVSMPVFQQGTPPFLNEGGAWALDGDGAPILQRTEEARLVVTVPRAAMPVAGFPAAVLIRTGAGGERPLVDRGVHAEEHGAAITPGTGPGLEFARAGFAGVSVDGPHGGLRNPDGGDEQFRVFNIQNPIALRDNLRQSAIELVLLARALDTMTFDASSCPGLVAASGAMRFDTAHLAVMGHSMGASIAPLAAAFEPRYRALILSGAGGSWIENVMFKELPIATRPAAEALLRYASLGRQLTIDDPVLGLLQWGGEAADAQVYARVLIDEPMVGEPRHVLMFQGIVDHYILPPIANVLSLSLAVDRAGPALDTTLGYTPIDDLLPLRGRGGVTLPAIGNVTTASGVTVTAVVSQHPEDGVEDGHETVFQTEGPKAQYRCFLRSFARGEMPRVPDPDVSDAACE